MYRSIRNFLQRMRMVTVPDRRSPSRISLVALAISFVAITLALYGITPHARGLNFPRQELTGTPALLIYGGTFVTPLLLGLIAAFMGGRSIALADRPGQTVGGAGPGTFAILIGLFAFVLGGTSTFVALIYPRLTA